MVLGASLNGVGIWFFTIAGERVFSEYDPGVEVSKVHGQTM